MRCSVWRGEHDDVDGYAVRHSGSAIRNRCISPRLPITIICFAGVLILTSQASARITAFAGRLEVKLTDTSSQIGSVSFAEIAGDKWLLTAHHNLRGLKCTAASCVQVRLASGIASHWRVLTDGRLYVLGELGVVAARVSMAGTAWLARNGARFAKTHSARTVGELQALQGARVTAVGNPAYELLGSKSRILNYVGSGTIGALASTSELRSGYDLSATPKRLWFVNGITITYGYSGGPLLLGEQIVGLVQGGDPRNPNGTSWAVPIQLVRDELEKPLSTHAFPGTLPTSWQADAFRESVYSQTTRHLVKIVSKNLEQLVVGERQLLLLTMSYSGFQHDVFVELQRHPSLEILGSENAVVKAGADMQQLSWQVRVLRNAVGPITLRFRLLDAQGDELLASEVALPIARLARWLAFEANAGTILAKIEGAAGNRFDSSAITLGCDFAPAVPVADWSLWALAPRVGLGAALFFSDVHYYDPLERQVLEVSRSKFVGVGFQAALLARYPLLPVLSAELGAAVQGLLFPGAGEGKDFGMGPEVGVRAGEGDNAFAIRYSWMRIHPFRRDLTYLNLAETEPTQSPSTWGHRVQGSYAF